MQFIAFTVKGLEKVAGDEITKLIPGSEIVEVGPKRIVFVANDIKTLLLLKTVDDIGLLIGMGQVGDLGSVAKQISALDLVGARKIITTARDVSDTFSITVSQARTQIDPGKLQLEISKLIAEKSGWHYTEFDHTNFDIRVFIDKDQYYVSVRITDKPLFHRAYKIASVKGALKPTIAASMVRLATQEKTGTVVDNFCGSGTILAEALSSGNQVYGGDIDTGAVEACKVNISSLGYNTEGKIKVLDATKTNWPDNHFDFAISNLPWDKQVGVESITQLYIGTLSEYARIFKPTGTICLLVSNPDLLIKHAKQILPDKNIFKTTIGFLGENPSILLIS